MASCAHPYSDRRTGEVGHGVSCAGCQVAIDKDIASGQAENWPDDTRDKLYTRDGFLKHFGDVKRLSFCGYQVMGFTLSLQSYLRVLEEESTLARDDEDDAN